MNDKEQLEAVYAGMAMMGFLIRGTPLHSIPEESKAMAKRMIEENTNIETHLSVANQIKSSTLIQYYNAMINRKDKSVILKNIHTPLLMIGGLHDLLIPIEQTMKEICYPNCSMISILKNSAHMGMIEEYEKTNKIISDFIRFANKL